MDSVLPQYPCLSGIQAEHVTTYMSFGEGRRVERSTTLGFPPCPCCATELPSGWKRRGRSPKQNKDKRKEPHRSDLIRPRGFGRDPQGRNSDSIYHQWPWVERPRDILDSTWQCRGQEVGGQRSEAFNLCVQTSDLTVLGLSD